jgi:serine/threonine protein kinase
MKEISDRLRSELAGRYTIERELGRGGMATIYLAYDLRHDRAVTLKVMHPEVVFVTPPKQVDQNARPPRRVFSCQRRKRATPLDSQRGGRETCSTREP